MKINVENFKCWENNEFVFKDNIILLNGESGSGKSSILDAIYFALTGEGKNLVTFGKTSCKVSVDMGGVRITRSKRPNRLVLQKGEIMYEDDVGQKMIDDMFSSNFNTIGYISQKDTSSFLKLTPLAKLEFLENLTLDALRLNEKKNDIKDETNKRKKAIDEISGKLKVAKDLFTSVVEVKKEPKFPIKSELSNEQVEEKYGNFLKESKTKQQELQSDYQKSANQLLKNKELETKKQVLQDKLKEYLLQKQDLENNKVEYDENVMKELLSNKKGIEILEELDKLDLEIQEKKTILVKEKEQFEKEKQEKIKEKEKKLWESSSEEETNECIQSLEEVLPDMKRFEYLEKSIRDLEKKKVGLVFNQDDFEKYESEKDNLEKKLQNVKLSKNVYSCPCCKISIKFDNNKLVEYKGIVEKEDEKETNKKLNEILQKIELLKKTRNNIESIHSELEKNTEELDSIKNNYEEITTSDEIMETINSYKGYLLENKKLEKELQEIRQKNENSKISFLEKEVLNMEKKYHTLLQKKIDVIYTDKEELEEKISEQRLLQTQYEHYVKTMKKCQDDIIRVEKEIETLPHVQSVNLEEIEKQMEDVKEKIKKYEMYVEKITTWKKEKEQYDIYQKHKKMYNDLVNEEENAKLKYESILILKEKIQLAESVYIQSYIRKINDNIQKYLDKFFLDENMQFNIKTQKTTLKSEVKNQINIDIFYKSNEVDVSTLSGGEYDRVNLAITLALAEVYNLPFIILDECLSSLDYENFDNVISSLKELYSARKVIIVSHQANEGLFDSIIDLRQIKSVCL